MAALLNCIRRRANANANVNTNAKVSPFSHSAGLQAQTCKALLYRKHGDPSQVVK